MRAKTLLILLVLVAAVTAALYMSRPAAEAAGEPGAARVGQPLFPGLSEKLNDVSSFTITSASGAVTVRKDGELWRVDGKDGYPARFEAVKRALVTLGDLRVLEAKTNKPELFAKLGVEDPAGAGATSALLTLQGSGGTPLASLVVGKAGPGNGTTFVRRATEDSSWLVRGSLAPEREASQWIDTDLPKLPSDRVKAVTVTHADGSAVTVARAAKEDPVWALQDVPEGMQAISPTIGRTLAGALESCNFEDVRSATGKPLGGESQAVAVFTTFDGLRLTVTSAVEDGKTWVTFAAMADEGAVEGVTKEVADLTAKLSPWVFQLPDYRAGNLRKRQSDLVQPKPEPAPEAPAAEPATEVPVEVPPADEPAPTPEPVPTEDGPK